MIDALDVAVESLRLRHRVDTREGLLDVVIGPDHFHNREFAKHTMSGRYFFCFQVKRLVAA